MWWRKKISERLVNDEGYTTLLACVNHREKKGYIGFHGNEAILKELFLHSMERNEKIRDLVLKISEGWKDKNSQYQD